jgi:nicotinate-nucleotide--dimethylbenzimidazole phosphoribosyltransferase
VSLLKQTLDSIKPLDVEAMTKASERQNSLTKPAGSLGLLEEVSIKLAGITGEVFNSISRKSVIVMAADHGVADEGVSAFPKEVTAQMALNFANGGAAINVLARHAVSNIVVVDVGVAEKLSSENIVDKKIRRGTGNIAKERAMSREEAIKAIEVGIEIVNSEIDKGARLIATGDMGIANTTVSSAVLTAFKGDVDDAVGRGTGVDDATYARKKALIADCMTLHGPDPKDALDVLEKVGGLEIAGIAGVIVGAAARRTPVVIDGFISGAGALIAHSLNSLCSEYIFASHVSVEPGHRLILDELGLRPMLFMDLRLGEGTGAVLAMNIIEAAAKIIEEMATFEEAGVSDKDSQ